MDGWMKGWKDGWKEPDAFMRACMHVCIHVCVWKFHSATLAGPSVAQCASRREAGWSLRAWLGAPIGRSMCGNRSIDRRPDGWMDA